MQTVFSKSCDEGFVVMAIPSCAKTLYDSGQCFNMYWKENKGCFAVISGNRLCSVRDEFCSLDPQMQVKMKKEDVGYWLDYFRVYDNFCYDMIVWKTGENDLVRKSALFGAKEGLTLLKQDLWETTVSFIISQRKNIPSIRRSLGLMREHLGNATETEGIRTLPSAEELLKNKKKLSLCSLGYRDEYLIGAAEAFVNGIKKRLLAAKDLNEHMEILMEIKGIGKKVASCICLFALGDMDAFPEDVWIKRIEDRLPENIQSYKNAGFLQQLLFYYVTQHKDQFADGDKKSGLK